MGIYSSRLSCWQRRKLGLKQDNAGVNTIEEVAPVEEVVVEAEKKVEDSKKDKKGDKKSK